MKQFLQLSCCICFFFLSEKIIAQVTKLSNNTNFGLAITLGNKAFLATDKDSIWITDGTPAGTKKLVSNVTIYKEEAAVYKNKIFFAGKNSAKGTELWVSDGTATDTKILKDIYTGASSSSPTNFFVFNNTLFFFATTAANGTELWKSDGTAGGTVMVKDINPGKPSSYDSTSALFFYPLNNVLLFEANDSVHGTELWKTNGTSSGTSLVKDLNAGKNSLQITTYNSLNNKFIFSGKDDATTGIKIWQTDGTSGGTTLIKTLLPNDINSTLNAQSLSKFNGQLVFAVTGYIISFPQFTMLNQLYVTNATSAGTKLIKDLADSSLGVSFGTLTPTINGKFYFTTYTSHGSLLWQSDATSSGTKVTKVIGNSLNLNSAHVPIILTDFLFTGSDSIGIKNFNGKFFIAADDVTHGYEPWITDGTATGTKLVKDIYKNKGSSLSLNLFSFVYSKQGLYFAANDSTTGAELWLSDGSSTGTKEVANINPGKKGSNPVIAGILNKHLLINADDGDNTQGKTDLYQVNATFDTLALVKSQEITEINTAPDGSTFSVYPNPAKDQLNISLNKNFNSQHVSFAIINQKGQQLYAE